MLPNIFFISILSSLIFTHSYSQCLHHQKSLLLQLKNELIFNSSVSTKLVQWNERDECCKWCGVGCDASGNVTSLQLDFEAISGGIGNSSGLFRLKYLEKLNLAYNHFNSNPIPKGIRNLTYLTHLNLSYAEFGGQVPLELSFLRRLVSLDISNDDWELSDPLSLEFPNLEMLVQNLTGLRELCLDGVFLSSHEKRKWSHIISSYLPNLTTLSLRDCSLSGPLARSFWQLHSLSILRLDQNDLARAVPDLFANFSSLTTLSLVNCRLQGSFPNRIFHIPTLQYIDLAFNFQLSGSIPPFTQTGSLNTIDLDHCRLTGSIPSTFANLTKLIYVSLHDNLFTGSLSSTLFGGLSNLVYLGLDGNSFSGKIPGSLFGLPSLRGLQLSSNQFIGLDEGFPIVNVSNIVTLDLSYNRLEGPIPDSFFQLQRLESLLLSGNSFTGTFQLDKIQSLANLTELDLSDNNLSVDDVGNDNSSAYGLPQLKVLGLASCNLYDFPDFMMVSNIVKLDLSGNRLEGPIPHSFFQLQSLESLSLSGNLFNGTFQLDKIRFTALPILNSLIYPTTTCQ